MPTAYLSPSLLQDLTNVSASPGAGNTGYPLVWNNTSGRFELAVLGVAGGGTGAITAASARTNLGLGTIATQNADSVNITGGSIQNISSFSATSKGIIQSLTVGRGGNTTVVTNTAVGIGALDSVNLTGVSNTAIGHLALISNMSGYSNNAAGSSCLKGNTTGNNNNAMGAFALYSNTSGGSNNAMGAYALYFNTIGVNNAGVGINTLFSNITGNDNIAVGSGALQNSTMGNNNTAIGGYSLFDNTTGSGNVGIGFRAGDSITVGTNNIIIGANLDPDSPTGSNQINIGNVYFHDRFIYGERTDPPVPSANQAVTYVRDNGSGKTQLCVRFNTGAVQVLATEP